MAVPAPTGEFTSPEQSRTGAAAGASPEETPRRRGPRTGVWLYPGVPAPALVDAVIAADELGLDEVWIADEGVGREPITVFAAAARATRRVRFAVGITSPVLRHPGAIAATAATLDELSDGRAVLGFGVGGHESLEPFGLVADRPVAIVRDAVATARAVLARRTGDGYDPPRHAFGPRSVPLWIGARGPQLTRLAGRVADGIFLSGCTAEEHVEIVERVRTAARERGLAPVEVALYQSAGADTSSPSVVAWDRIGEVLAREAAAHAPTAIGINLVDLAAGPDVDPVPLVERAAAVLRNETPGV